MPATATDAHLYHSDRRALVPPKSWVYLYHREAGVPPEGGGRVLVPFLSMAITHLYRTCGHNLTTEGAGVFPDFGDACLCFVSAGCNAVVVSHTYHLKRGGAHAYHRNRGRNVTAEEADVPPEWAGACLLSLGSGAEHHDSLSHLPPQFVGAISPQRKRARLLNLGARVFCPFVNGGSQLSFLPFTATEEVARTHTTEIVGAISPQRKRARLLWGRVSFVLFVNGVTMVVSPIYRHRGSGAHAYH